MRKTKTPTKKTTKKPKTPKTIYRLTEKTDQAKPIADCPSATEAIKQASAYANEHQVVVAVSRGTLTGDTFQVEFTELMMPTHPEPITTPEPNLALDPTTPLEPVPETPTEPAEPTPTEPKKTHTSKPKPEPKPRKLSALAAAAKVLAKTGEAMTTKSLIETMTREGLWSSPQGKTPESTLYAAILREVATKGKQARFKKTSPGHFAFNVDSTRE